MKPKSVNKFPYTVLLLECIWMLKSVDGNVMKTTDLRRENRVTSVWNTIENSKLTTVEIELKENKIKVDKFVRTNNGHIGALFFIMNHGIFKYKNVI
jgi:hypothetical protein